MTIIDPAHLQVVNLLGSTQLPVLDASLTEWGWTAWRLHGAGVMDAATLFDRAGQDLPSPFPHRATSSFDAFADSLWEAAVTSGAENIAFVWTDVQEMLQGGLGDLLLATTILRRLSHRLADLGSPASTGAMTYTFLVGRGPNFPDLPTRG